MPNFNFTKFLEDWKEFNPNIEITLKDNVVPKKTDDLVVCHCNICNETFEQTPKYLRLAIRRKPEAKGCKICLKQGVKKRKDTIYTLEKINEILKENNSQVIALEELPEHKLKCYCSKCGQTFIQYKYNTRDSKSCPICYGKKVISGVNDLKTTDPETASYFISEEYITTHTANTHEKGEAKCPNCGATKMMLPKNLRAQGFGCPFCSDGVSYPNKFIRELIKQLPVENIINEYSPEWISPKRYDVYFEYNNNKYIIEMDGALHYEDTNFHGLEKCQKSDQIKDKLAKEHNIKIIRIDALKSELDYLKQQILNSELSNLIDLSFINWNKCAEVASSNLMKEACNIYSNTTKSSNEIAKELNISQATVIKYLNKGAQINLCDYTPQDGSNRSKKRTIYVLDKNKNLILIASCIKEAFEELKQKYPDKNFIYTTGLTNIKDKKEYLDFYFLKENEYNRKEAF